MKLIVDRFESEYAVLLPESGTPVNIPRSLLADAREGDVYVLRYCRAESDARRKKLSRLGKGLFE